MNDPASTIAAILLPGLDGGWRILAIMANPAGKPIACD